MAKLTLSIPTIGEKRSIAEPKVDTAFKAVEEWANGNIGSNNIEAKGVTEAMLSTAVQTLLNEKTAGGVLKKSIIATEQERESAVYGTLTTPDEVEVTLAENGLIAIWYQATWKESVSKAARAALFIGATQLKIAAPGSAPVVESACTNSAETAKFMPLASFAGGLAAAKTGAVGSSADVTTGQVVGVPIAAYETTEAGAATEVSSVLGGPCWVFAAAGTYKISVKFKASAGKVTAKTRKLWALAYA